MQSTTKKINKFRTNILASAISLCLPYSLQAANFDVTQSIDNGTGLVPNTLSWAVLQANMSPDNDFIILKSDVLLTGVMKRLIDSNITMQSDSTRRTIKGLGQYRPLFIKSGSVIINDIDIQGGLAKGGVGSGAGAGMGGSLFIYDGNVKINNVTISYSSAQGTSSYGNGGGGMFGDGTQAGGGLFANNNGNSGGYGGYGNYDNSVARFGKGGSYQGQSVHGGFAGGGSFSSGYGGNGGFGGGGGFGFNLNGGDGGFGGGSGASALAYSGAAGFGASNGNSAGMGGAIFIRSGTVDLKQVSIFSSNATATTGAQGLGGAIFILHTINNSNNNNQGMPTTLANVNACEMLFFNNSASNAVNMTNNSNDIFDLSNRINASNGLLATDMCPPDLMFFNGFED